MMRGMRRLTLLSGFLAVFLLAGCATWLMKGEPPEVLVTNVTPLEASAFEQRLQVDLRIRNPNDFDLAVTGIDFRLDLNGNRLVRGLGNKELVVPRLSDAVTTVETSTSTLQVVRQLLSFSGNQSLTYHVTGVLHTKDGRLPFDTSGLLLDKGALSVLPLPSNRSQRTAGKRQVAQTAYPARPQQCEQTRRTPCGTLSLRAMRERSWEAVSAAC
jgi:LEA14-like dessication related protein